MTAELAQPTPISERALGPDLARGLMLQFIALANSHYFLNAPSVLGGYPQRGSTIDSAITWAISTFVDGRAFPMFGLLFGYGIAQIARRQQTRGPRALRRLLWRRGLILVGVGFVHAVLLYVGDILSVYGVLLIVGAWMVRWKDRSLLLVAAVFFALTALPSDSSSTISSDPPHASMLPPDVATMLTERPPIAIFIAVLGPVGFICPFVIGLWTGRRRILEHPAQHRLLLLVVASVGITTAVIGAQPVALMLSGAVTPPDTSTLELWGSLHDATGVIGGFGYAAFLSLLAVRLQARPRAAVRAIAATGQRSMTMYLAQSVVWTIAFTPFLLNLSDTLTVTTTALLATATWLGSVALANWMQRTGRRGPFEVLVRRLTYREWQPTRTTHTGPAAHDRPPSD